MSFTTMEAYAVDASGSRFCIPLPWTRPPLSMNDRMHFQQKASLSSRVRSTSAALGKSGDLSRLTRPCGRVAVTLHYQQPDRRRRDEDNLVATSKPCCDGLVDAGLVSDDTQDIMPKGMPILHPPVKGEKGALWLIVEILEY